MLFIVLELVLSLVNLLGVTQSDPAVSNSSWSFFVVKCSKAALNEAAGCRLDLGFNCCG